MRKHLDKDLVALFALLAAAVWGTWLVARAELELDVEWTDGRVRYEATDGARVRHAIWDDAQLLGGSVNSSGQESRPALSPDGRFLVFATGERGLNVDLWIAEVLGAGAAEGLGEARPLARVNSAADDLAPAFGLDGLYFASDRGGAQYGLDLWRVDYADGVFGEPESVGTGINTANDETDPYPAADGSLIFASDRPRGGRKDFDLYLATRVHEVRGELVEGEEAPGSVDNGTQSGGAGSGPRFEVVALDALNSPFDERDPALAVDGRTLYFASERVGGVGGFDLWRSFDEGLGWLPPRPLVGVNTGGDERGPLPSRDGFALLFDATDAAGPVGGASGSGEGSARGVLEGSFERSADLWSARSTELFRVPREPLGWGELLILAVLLLLALLAILAKRWRGIAVLYRCFLASLVVHLLALWLLRDVAPETPPVLSAPSEQLFKVRLAVASAGKSASLAERGGELSAERSAAAQSAAAQPARVTSEQVAAAQASREAAPASASLAAAERGAESAPERAGGAAAAPAAELAAASGVRAVQEVLGQHGGARPELVVGEASSVGERSANATGEAPSRAESSEVTSARGSRQPAPSRASFAAVRSGEEPTAEVGRRRLEAAAVVGSS
ncbi:MAG: hypothetical protein P1V81_14415, partial [Planctomycetota bacterium]|nr:hypothetical protein [Planctomycetota bacterium]